MNQAQESANNPQTGPEATISINSKSFRIHRGRNTVVEIKRVGGVPLADELEQLIDGKLVPLTDDGAVTIKGSEVFISHVRDSGSSAH